MPSSPSMPITASFSRPTPPRWNEIGGAGGATGPAGCPYALNLVLSDRVALDAHLSDDAGADSGVTDADGNVPYYLVGHVLDGLLVHVDGVVELLIPARAHDDVETGGLRYSRQGQGVSPDADAGDVYDGAAAAIAELHCLFYRRTLVNEQPVVP